MYMIGSSRWSIAHYDRIGIQLLRLITRGKVVAVVGPHIFWHPLACFLGLLQDPAHDTGSGKTI